MFFSKRRRAQHDAHHEHEINCLSLCCARNGQRVCVKQLAGCAEECSRLRDLGVREGAVVTVLKHGSPMVVRIDGARYGLGQSAATNVICEVVAE